ncbi:hypothetical protein EYF80_057925 [Liparis tanakae]|uniref:Uncharacterized protein n=1 Tax=Liparis tanakae TaxID=230148 RepID=A0A4Z2ESM9_9TELE|nr:hypothetical protein EYF80_057925 [Liparis tanakae]
MNRPPEGRDLYDQEINRPPERTDLYDQAVDQECDAVVNHISSLKEALTLAWYKNVRGAFNHGVGEESAP